MKAGILASLAAAISGGIIRSLFACAWRNVISALRSVNRAQKGPPDSQREPPVRYFGAAGIGGGEAERRTSAAGTANYRQNGLQFQAFLWT